MKWRSFSLLKNKHRDGSNKLRKLRKGDFWSQDYNSGALASNHYLVWVPPRQRKSTSVSQKLIIVVRCVCVKAKPTKALPKSSGPLFSLLSIPPHREPAHLFSLEHFFSLCVWTALSLDSPPTSTCLFMTSFNGSSGSLGDTKILALPYSINLGDATKYQGFKFISADSYIYIKSRLYPWASEINMQMSTQPLLARLRAQMYHIWNQIPDHPCFSKNKQTSKQMKRLLLLSSWHLTNCHAHSSSSSG